MRQTGWWTTLVAAAMTAALSWLPLGAGAQALTEEQGQAILQELKGIRQLLERIEKQGGPARPARPQAPKSASISTKGRPAMGSPDAPVTLVEFTDYQCPFCSRFFQNTLPLLKRDYIDTGKVRLVVKDLPLKFHPNARKAAQAAHCAGEQGAFWPMHDTLYRNTKRLDEKFLPGYAEQLSLDAEAFQACLASDRHLKAIDKDAAEAQRVRITGTPSFIIGRTTNDIVNGAVIRGAQPYTVFKGTIKQSLNAAKVGKGP